MRNPIPGPEHSALCVLQDRMVLLPAQLSDCSGSGFPPEHLMAVGLLTPCRCTCLGLHFQHLPRAAGPTSQARLSAGGCQAGGRGDLQPACQHLKHFMHTCLSSSRPGYFTFPEPPQPEAPPGAGRTPSSARGAPAHWFLCEVILAVGSAPSGLLPGSFTVWFPRLPKVPGFSEGIRPF